MASQAASGSDVYYLASFVRGLHAYKHIWEPRIGEVLILRREPENCQDKIAVAVMKSDSVVGHVPYEIAAVLSHFLKREFNKGTAEITGTRVNRLPKDTLHLLSLRTTSVCQESGRSDREEKSSPCRYTLHKWSFGLNSHLVCIHVCLLPDLLSVISGIKCM